MRDDIFSRRRSLLPRRDRTNATSKRERQLQDVLNLARRRRESDSKEARSRYGVGTGFWVQFGKKFRVGRKQISALELILTEPHRGSTQQRGANSQYSQLVAGCNMLP